MGWFKLKGKDGARTLEEQMLGVTPLLAEVAGKRVLDLGCAEGLIALEFAKAGAEVVGCDVNGELIAEAQRLIPRELLARVRFDVKRVQELMREEGPHRYDVVLALAILHKLNRPRACMRWIERTGARLVAIRLPGGSKGFFLSKHRGTPCDVNRSMSAFGFRLERTLPGPRDELVQHWRR